MVLRYSGWRTIILEDKDRPAECEHLTEGKLDQCFLKWLEFESGFSPWKTYLEQDPSIWETTCPLCPIPLSSPAEALAPDPEQTLPVPLHHPPATPLLPLLLTTKSADFPDMLQGSPLQEGCWERILFSETFGKSKELLYNTAIQRSLSFNRYGKGYCMLFIILVWCNFMLLPKTLSADRGTSSCLRKIW